MTTITNGKPFVVYVTGESSATIGSFFVTLANGEMKSYLLRAGKHGNLVLIADDEMSRQVMT